ncbi:hypothetical protein [Candidatus Magnetaquicoccus inordinatus]|uniref:hypothetical protein n=1 Tax=Candidatus Magnetaquicoccus inordinatus TaxID=2496818 RepID=UPI00102C9271|nr:hypothetical protein [Candidatus Magnetaquicoccus inordinatus]
MSEIEKETDDSAVRRVRMIRVPYDKDVVLHLDDGRVVSGQATNLNATGFFMAMDIGQVDSSLAGANGYMVEELHGERLTMACRIVRVVESGVGVLFLNGS